MPEKKNCKSKKEKPEAEVENIIKFMRDFGLE